MSQLGKKREAAPMSISSMERLSLRVSSMINHPIAQERRVVRIHRLDTDGAREWSEILAAMSEVDGIEMIFHNEDDSVTLRWEPSYSDDRLEVAEESQEEAASLF